VLAKRQAQARVALFQLGQEERVWPLLRHRPDPRVRSYLIHLLGPLGSDPDTIQRRLEEESDVSIRRALLLCLGEFSEDRLPVLQRQALAPKLMRMYREDPDPGIHGATEWLLRQWKQQEWLRQTNAGWAKDKETREKRLEDIKRVLAKEKEKAEPQWYVSG